MTDKFQGKRADLGIYDDASNFTDEEIKTYKDMLVRDSFDTGINILDDRLWVDGSSDIELIVPSPKLLHDKATAERYSKFIDKFNSLGCTSFMMTAEQIKSLMENKFDNTNLMEGQNDAR